MFDGEPGAAFEDEVVIRRLRFTAEDTGFAVVDADRGGDDVVLVGTLAHLEERERVRIEGIWADDKRFGMQVKVRVAESVPPSGEEALLAYLKRVKHIGLGRAGRLLDRYGDDVLFAIDQDPATAFRIAGLNPKRVNEAIRSWNALRSTRALHLLLAPHGLAWLVPRIAAEYGDRAHDVVRSRPYELTSVFGVGFAIADTIARAAGVPRDSIGRTRAAVIHVLTEAERDGSTCLPVPDLATSAAKLLGGPPPDAALLQDMFAAEQIVLEQDATVLWAYRPPTAKLEAELADTIRRLREAEPILKPARLSGPAPAVPAVAGGGAAAPPASPPRRPPAGRRSAPARRIRPRAACRRAAVTATGLALRPRFARPRGLFPRPVPPALTTSSPSARTRPRRAHPRPRAVGRGRGGVRVAALDRHRRARHRQDRDDPADLRGGQGAAGFDRARRAHRPRGAQDGRVDGDGRVDDPLRARLDSWPGADQGRDRRRPARRRRDVDGEPRAAGHAAPRRRRRDARRPGRRRRSARSCRGRQAVRGARRHEGRPGRRAHPHLPPGRRQHDRPRRARGPPGRGAELRRGREPPARPVPIERQDPQQALDEIESLVTQRLPPTTASTR